MKQSGDQQGEEKGSYSAGDELDKCQVCHQWQRGGVMATHTGGSRESYGGSVKIDQHKNYRQQQEPSLVASYELWRTHFLRGVS